MYAKQYAFKKYSAQEKLVQLEDALMVAHDNVRTIEEYVFEYLHNNPDIPHENHFHENPLLPLFNMHKLAKLWADQRKPKAEKIQIKLNDQNYITLPTLGYVIFMRKFSNYINTIYSIHTKTDMYYPATRMFFEYLTSQPSVTRDQSIFEKTCNTWIITKDLTEEIFTLRQTLQKTKETLHFILAASALLGSAILAVGGALYYVENNKPLHNPEAIVTTLVPTPITLSPEELLQKNITEQCAIIKKTLTSLLTANQGYTYDLPAFNINESEQVINALTTLDALTHTEMPRILDQIATELIQKAAPSLDPYWYDQANAFKFIPTSEILSFIQKISEPEIMPSLAEQYAIALSVNLFGYQYNINPQLLLAKQATESDFYTRSLSDAGAYSFAQIMPENFAPAGITWQPHFKASEFSDRLSLTMLQEKLKQDFPKHVATQADPLSSLNELITYTGFYRQAREFKKEIMTVPIIQRYAEITYRYRSSVYADLNANGQFLIKMFNRYILSALYPELCPKPDPSELFDVIQAVRGGTMLLYQAMPYWKNYPDQVRIGLTIYNTGKPSFDKLVDDAYINYAAQLSVPVNRFNARAQQALQKITPYIVYRNGYLEASRYISYSLLLKIVDTAALAPYASAFNKLRRLTVQQLNTTTLIQDSIIPGVVKKHPYNRTVLWYLAKLPKD